MAESQVIIRLDRELLLTFKAACLRRESSVTREVHRLIVAQMRDWQEPITYVAHKDTRHAAH